MNDLFSELRRRHVFKVAAAYGVVAWLLIQVCATTFPAFGAPQWVLRVVITLAVAGFPVALVIAWAFELTPDGVRRAEPVAGSEDRPRQGKRWPFDNRAAGWLGVGIVVGLTTVGAYGWTRLPDRNNGDGADGVKSIAVLPFAAIGDGTASEYLSEGISEELLNALSLVPQLQVAARSSSFSFQGQAVALDSIARALGVHHVLEGSVREAGDRVRISAQLVDAASGRQMWSQSYDREMEDVLAIQQEIAVAIANALQVKLAGGDSARLVRSRTADPQAYELYLQGRKLVSDRTAASLAEAIVRFQGALDRDPAFAAAYSGLADAYALLEDYGGIPREEAFPKAIAAATRALELDELQAEAHTSLGHIYYHQRNWAAGEREFLRALELNPSYATAHHWYANLLVKTDRIPQAVREIERAYELDPLSPKIEEIRARMLYYARRYDDAISSYEAQIGSDPENLTAHFWVVWIHVSTGRSEQATASAQRFLDLAQGEVSPVSQALLAITHATAGRQQEAQSLLRQLERLPAEEAPLNLMLAAYRSLGDLDGGFRTLGRAIDQEGWFVETIPIDPILDPFRQDPRFERVLARVAAEDQ